MSDRQHGRRCLIDHACYLSIDSNATFLCHCVKDGLYFLLLLFLAPFANVLAYFWATKVSFGAKYYFTEEEADFNYATIQATYYP